MKQSKFITAPMIASFLLDIQDSDCQELSALLDDKQTLLYLHPVTVSACCDTLERLDETLSQRDISDGMIRFVMLDEVHCVEHESILKALEVYGRTDVQFSSAWVTVLSRELADTVSYPMGEGEPETQPDTMRSAGGTD